MRAGRRVGGVGLWSTRKVLLLHLLGGERGAGASYARARRALRARARFRGGATAAGCMHVRRCSPAAKANHTLELDVDVDVHFGIVAYAKDTIFSMCCWFMVWYYLYNLAEINFGVD